MTAREGGFFHILDAISSTPISSCPQIYPQLGIVAVARTGSFRMILGSYTRVVIHLCTKTVDNF